MRHFSIAFGSAVLAVTGSVAQDRGAGAPISDPALWAGASTWNVAASATTGTGYLTDALLGVVYNPITQETYVTGRRDTSSATSQHLIHVFDKDGTWVAGVAQHTAQQASAWGFRDGCWNKDQANPLFYFGGDVIGTQAELYKFDGVNVDPAPLPLTNYPHPTVRALTYGADVNGLNTVNSGQDWVAATDWSGSISFHDLASGQRIKTIPSIQSSTYGLAFNPIRATLLAHGQDGGPASHPRNPGVNITEGRLDGTLTGIQFFGDLSLTVSNAGVTSAGGIAGGLSGYIDGATGAYRLLGLSQALPDDQVWHVDGQAQFGACSAGVTSFEGFPFETRQGFKVTLEDAPGTASNAYCLLGAPHYAGVSLPPVATCNIHLDFSIYADVVGPFTVSGGKAQIPPFLIPDGTFGAEMAFQWVVTNAALPVDLAQPATVYINRK